METPMASSSDLSFSVSGTYKYINSELYIGTEMSASVARRDNTQT